MARPVDPTLCNLPPLVSKILTVLVWMIVAIAIARIGMGEKHFQWDFRVFHAAPVVLESGGNPYDNSTSHLDIPSSLSYLYPPILLHALKPLTKLSFSTAYLVWFAIKLAALVLLLRLWHRHFERLNFGWPMVLFLTLAFNSAILRDLTAGNVATLEQLGLWTGFYCLIRKRPYLAGAIIAVTAQIKLMPVVFLGLLLFVGPAREWKPLFASLGIFFGLLLLNYLFMPEMTAHYIESFGSSNPNLDERGEINPSSLAMLRDIAAVANDAGVPIGDSLIRAAYLLYVGLLTAGVLWVLVRYSDHLHSIDLKWLIYCGCVLFVLVMPRVKDYTYMALLMPALFVLRHAGPGPMVPLLGVLLFLPPTDSYVPGLGNSFVTWVQSYMDWFIAWFMLYFVAQAILSSAQQDEHYSRTLVPSHAGGGSEDR